ncbi:probable E3 ubiquitin-protein ligase TRIM8 isoform X2 [Myripristis murdjan]|uniref:E3 ubiquitin-protein ligase TRIM8 n=2 Tax=Myripristis murdjan TaxID=586833 RepID=A0A667YQY3_9TELE|nr:probable E3 ubiquitin-protein ligase TRIM8 isoform X2 [Myripristis murdjan]XP_029926245.1 probable E3 ubiquitin-protein ligase TRIM8 isoform X2 [Myripristis murdjan]
MDPERWKDSFEEELLCPICLTVFDEPVQLPCKHNFCKDCISEAWARDTAAVRCPECNHDYIQKPALERNIKLANIVERFNALSTEKSPATLDCSLCRRGPGPPLPVQKVCLRCKEPCCQTHIHTHLQQPCTFPGHLLVDVEELKAWTCTKHDEYRLLHCEEEQVALCPFCCITRCTGQRHTVCDVEKHRMQLQAMLMRQQESLNGRVQNIDEQLGKLETDRTLIQEAVSELKERVKAQYQRMHALLEVDMSETMQIVDGAHGVYRQRNSQQALQLKEQRQEADKLRTSAQMFFERAENINCMKNTKPYQMLIDRSNSYLGTALPPHRVGQLNCVHFLTELSKREKDLRKMLQESFSETPILQTVPSLGSGPGTCAGTGSGPEKRKFDVAFQESKPGTSSSHDRPSLACSSKKILLADHSYRDSSYSSEGLSQTAPAVAGPSRVVDGSGHHMVGHHSGTVFPPSPFSGGGTSQQAMLPQYEGRKVLMCTLENCYCSRAPPRGHPSYTVPNSFHWMAPQEFVPPHAQLPTGQTLQGLPMRGLMDAAQAPRPANFYGLYGQASNKHYVVNS